MSASRLRVGRPAPTDLSKEWLSAEVRRLGSISVVAAAHGMSARSLRLAARRLRVREPRPYERARPERPAFFDEEWMRSEFEEHGSYLAVAKKHGYDWAALMVTGRAFGIDEQARYDTGEQGDHAAHPAAVWLRAELAKFGSLREVAGRNELSYSHLAAAAKDWGIDPKAEELERPTPSFLNEAWLRAQLERQPLVSQVAARYGLPVSVVAAAVTKYKIDVQSEYWAKKVSRRAPVVTRWARSRRGAPS